MSIKHIHSFHFALFFSIEFYSSKTESSSMIFHVFVVFGLLTLLVKFVHAQYSLPLAGSGYEGRTGDGGPATSARVNFPAGVWVDTNGVTFFADEFASVVRKVDTSGIITTIGGTGTSVISNSGGAFTSVPLFYPWGVVGDSTYLYVSDYYHIWKYTRSTGIVSILAGTGTLGVSGNGGPATSAQVNKPYALWLTTGDVLYLAESGSNLVRMITLSNNIISTVAGSGVGGFGGDGESPTSTNTALNGPQGVYVDTNGIIFIADYNNHRIRYIQNGIIDTYAGGGANTGTGFVATSSKISFPVSVTGDTIGNIFIVELGDKIKVIDYQTKIISSFITGLYYPRGIWFDRVNNRTVIAAYLYVITDKLYSNPLSDYPTAIPTIAATRSPSRLPTRVPTRIPSAVPSGPSMLPTMNPTASPSMTPTFRPSRTPTVAPSAIPTMLPSISPSAYPTSSSPSVSPSTAVPSTISPSEIPSGVPTTIPTDSPTMMPTPSPTHLPSSAPTTDTAMPTASPTASPSEVPTATPSLTPTAVPFPLPTLNPTMVPSSFPTVEKEEIVQVEGVSRVKFVNGESLNSLSLSTLLSAFQNISENAQSTDISSTALITESLVEMIPHRQNVRGSVSLATFNQLYYTYDIGFVSTYLLSYHQGYTSAQVASAKSVTIRQAIEGGQFESVLRSFARAKNATQLLNGTCSEVTSLSATITASFTSSSSDRSNLNATVIIIVVVCVVVVLLCLCGGVLFYRKKYLEEGNQRKVYVTNSSSTVDKH